MVEKEKKVENAGNGGTADNTTPQVAMLAQYIRDLSFENPNAPASLQNESGKAPNIDVGVNVSGRKVNDDIYEIELSLSITSKVEDLVQYVVELKFASLFGIRNVPEPTMNSILLIQAPTLLFPFARRVIADAVRDGGYAPLLLDPVNFEAMYRQQAEQAEKAKAADDKAPKKDEKPAKAKAN